MAFLFGSDVSSYGRQLRARRLESWRAAADLVWSKWNDVVAAPLGDRRTAFAAYTDALDAEAAAAARLADLPSSLTV